MMFAGAAIAVFHDHYWVVLPILASVSCRALHFGDPEARLGVLTGPVWFREQAWATLVFSFGVIIQLTLPHAGDQNA